MQYYDPDEVRSIPLVDVARRLGLSMDERGYTDCLAHWGAVGTERGSCSLNEADNYFRCPCGNSGWATDLVSQTRRRDIVDSIQWLGAEFGLTPVRTPKKTDYVSRSRGLDPKSSADDSLSGRALNSDTPLKSETQGTQRSRKGRRE